MKLKIGYILFFVLGVLHSFATTVQDKINESNTLFKEKQYVEASTILISLLNQNHANSSIYYNLGNCFYQLKEYPKAILAYEKGKKLDRSNSNLQHNLNLAYNKALSKIETSKQFFLFQWMQNLIYKYNLKTWSICFIISIWLFGIFGFFYFRNRNNTLFSLTLLGSLCSILFFWISYKNYKYQNTNTHAIVMQTTNSYTNPSELKKTKNTIEAGNKLQLLDEDGDFFKVKTMSDKIIWIHKNKVAEF